MCEHCGCGINNHVHLINPKKPEIHKHIPSVNKTIHIEQDILEANNLLAANNRKYFMRNNILCINLLSSPGAGKTTLLEQTIKAGNTDTPIYVIEGDQQTTNDADRIDKTGAKAVQINTGTACHLDANMIKTAIVELNPKQNSILFIENVGNLICPALFDLGEQLRVVIISVTEGDDKPLKYPNIFEDTHICIIHKTDLLPYVDFNIDKTKEYILRNNQQVKFFTISSTTQDGLHDWLTFIHKTIVNS